LPQVGSDNILWVKEFLKYHCPQEDEPPAGDLCKLCEVFRFPLLFFQGFPETTNRL